MTEVHNNNVKSSIHFGVISYGNTKPVKFHNNAVKSTAIYKTLKKQYIHER